MYVNCWPYADQNHRWGNGGGLGPPTFLARGAWPLHFSVKNIRIINKKLINAVAGFGPPHFKLRFSIYDQNLRPSEADGFWMARDAFSVLCRFFTIILGLFHCQLCNGNFSFHPFLEKGGGQLKAPRPLSAPAPNEENLKSCHCKSVSEAILRRQSIAAHNAPQAL